MFEVGCPEAKFSDAEGCVGNPEAFVGDAEGCVGDAMAMFGDAEAFVDDAMAKFVDAEGYVGDAEGFNSETEFLNKKLRALPTLFARNPVSLWGQVLSLWRVS